MESWHQKLATEILSDSAPRAGVDGAAQLEIAFGKARAALAYVLELARAHRLAATGSVVGDSVWLQLGHGRVRLTLNRRESHVIVRSLDFESKLRWDDVSRSVVDDRGKRREVESAAKEAIDELVATWKLHPSQRLSTAPPPNRDDEPTRS